MLNNCFQDTYTYPAPPELKKALCMEVRKIVGPIAVPEQIHWAPALPKTRSGKIMRRILRKIADQKVCRKAAAAAALDRFVCDAVHLCDSTMRPLYLVLLPRLFHCRRVILETSQPSRIPLQSRSSWGCVACSWQPHHKAATSSSLLALQSPNQPVPYYSLVYLLLDLDPAP